MPEIDGLPPSVHRQVPVQKLERLDASRKLVKIDFVATTLASRIEPNQRRDELQIVLDAMLQLLEEKILIAQLACHFFALRSGAGRHVNKRCYAIILRAVLVLDEAGICLNDDRPRLVALKRSQKLFAALLKHRLLERNLRIILFFIVGQDRPT